MIIISATINTLFRLALFAAQRNRVLFGSVKVGSDTEICN